MWIQVNGDRALRRTFALCPAVLVSLVTLGCGHGSGPTAPDEVPASERAEHLAAMKNRLDDPPRLVPMTIAEVMALPTFPRNYTRSQLAEISSIENRGVTVAGFVTRLRQMDDGDWHIQITESPVGCLRHDTVDQLITELTPGIRARKPAYTFEQLQALCGVPTQIRVSGWLLYDSPHKGDSGRGTPWEVHPVTRIEVCCWQELS